MRLAREMRAVLAAVCAVASMRYAVANGPIFRDAPISCSGMVQYKECRASFDGRTLRIAYSHREGKDSVAVYTNCVTALSGIYCPGGQWQADGGSGKLGPRSIGLREGLPFPD